MKRFLAERLKLRINVAKSACDWASARKFLGYGLTRQSLARLRVAPQSLQRLMGRIKALLRQGRGRSLSRTIETLNPLLCGWIGYFQCVQAKGELQVLDGWLRRRLRCLLWRQAKHRQGRTRMLRRQGLAEDRAWCSARNGYGPSSEIKPTASKKRFGKAVFMCGVPEFHLDSQQRFQHHP